MNKFTADWIADMPRRWARNGGFVGFVWAAVMIAAMRTDQIAWLAAWYLAFTIGLIAFIGWVAGILARRGLLKASSVPETFGPFYVRSIPIRYATLGALALLLVPLSDLLLKWRGDLFAPSTRALENVTQILVAPLVGFFVGLVIGLVTRSQLRRRLTIGDGSSQGSLRAY